MATSSQEYKNPKKKIVQHQEGYKKCITINVTYRRVREFAGELELKSKAEHLVFSNAWINRVYVLDCSKLYKMKLLSVDLTMITWLKETQNQQDRTILQFILVHIAWKNRIMPGRKDKTILDWILWIEIKYCLN